MKALLLTLAASMTIAGAASAQSVTVEVPANVRTPEGAKVYKAALDEAINKVCTRAFAPLVGPAWESYRACVKSTRADVAAHEPTGLYAARKPESRSLDLAAK